MPIGVERRIKMMYQLPIKFEFRTHVLLTLLLKMNSGRLVPIAFGEFLLDFIEFVHIFWR